MSGLTILLFAGLVILASVHTFEIDDKIVGGTDADITSFPYQVSLQQSNSHFCGGSIYNNRIIVTAAHCVKAVTDPTTIKIRYGSSYWSSGGTLIGVQNYKIHPSFNSTTMQNDIAILKTNAAIVWSSSTKSIYMATAEPSNSINATISGWGTLYSGATTLPSQLQSATVKIISRASCQSSEYGYGSSIGSTMICAGSSGIDSCQGDSGGPLVANGAQVGIVSWGSGCAQDNYPGVYSSVAVLRSFITTYAKAL